VHSEIEFSNRRTIVSSTSSTRALGWYRYYGFLRIISQRHAEVQRAFLEAMRRQHEVMQREIAAGGGPRPVTPEEEAEDLRVAEITNRLHLEIESFYVFAKILVDRMADTSAFYFGFNWGGRGSTHGKLARSLDTRCRNLGLTIQPPELPALISELQKRIVEYRNKDVEHVSEPGLMHGTMYDLTEGKARIAPVVVCPADPAESGREHADKRPELPEEMLPLIDSYAAALLHFFEANVEHSIAGCPSQPQ
jgi:hypothetical protein